MRPPDHEPRQHGNAPGYATSWRLCAAVNRSRTPSRFRRADCGAFPSVVVLRACKFVHSWSDRHVFCVDDVAASRPDEVEYAGRAL